MPRWQLAGCFWYCCFHESTKLQITTVIYNLQSQLFSFTITTFFYSCYDYVTINDIIFTTIASNVAIRLANWMPFSIRVQTTLLASKCHSVVAHWKNPFIWRRYCGKKQIGGALWVHNFLTTVMTNIVVDKSTDHTKPLSICWTLLHIYPHL